MVPVSQTRHSIYKNEIRPLSRVFRVLPYKSSLAKNWDKKFYELTRPSIGSASHRSGRHQPRS